MQYLIHRCWVCGWWMSGWTRRSSPTISRSSWWSWGLAEGLWLTTCAGWVSWCWVAKYWTAHIRPQAEAWKAEALIGFSVVKTCVCLSVCSQATGHSFWATNLIFWHNTPWDMRKKRNILFFEILIFGPLRALFGHFLAFLHFRPF